MVSETKSRAGRRSVGIPQPVVEALEEHRKKQQEEREAAGNLWEEVDWVFTNRFGRPVHPTEDHKVWKSLLREAGVRDARLHDARHTAATVLLALKVPLPAVMQMMGWSDAGVAKRYMHVDEELLHAVAQDVGQHMWIKDGGETEVGDNGTGDQREAVRKLAESMPEHVAKPLLDWIDGDDEGPAGGVVPT